MTPPPSDDTPADIDPVDATLIDLKEASPELRRDAGRVLIQALAGFPSAWKTPEEAAEEIAAFVELSARCSIVACRDDKVLGWVGAIKVSPHAWELHPLVVAPEAQGKGLGTVLVFALERFAASQGVLTLWLGSDDDYGGTTLYGQDLFPDPLAPLRKMAPVNGHPFTFYQRLGYAVCGVIPDAAGPGRPDILLAKRLTPASVGLKK
jgi:aminoglycoside 6'-N-acetyltransferase I